MVHYQRKLMLHFLKLLIMIMAVHATEHEMEFRGSSASYLEMKDVFQELGAEAPPSPQVDENYLKKQGYQNLMYAPISHPAYSNKYNYYYNGQNQPQPSSVNYYGSYYHQQQHQRPLQPEQLQQPSPANFPSPLQQNYGEVLVPLPSGEKDNSDKLDASSIDVQFDYSEVDTIQGGLNFEKNFEIMEMVE